MDRTRRSFYVFTFISVVLLLLVSGCLTGPTNQETPQAIRIASWNIRGFGVTKAFSFEGMRVIANAVDRFDIIGVQEISNVLEKSDPRCPGNEGKCPRDRKCG
ncbi:MAG: hypothetical protein GTN74_05095 [Proteobacteria bacterium]|nr:hypothetical protein [Pseudomonadota bacterium]